MRNKNIEYADAGNYFAKKGMKELRARIAQAYETRDFSKLTPVERSYAQALIARGEITETRSKCSSAEIAYRISCRRKQLEKQAGNKLEAQKRLERLNPNPKKPANTHQNVLTVGYSI